MLNVAIFKTIDNYIMLRVNSLNQKPMLPSNNHRCQGDKGGLSKLFPKYILETDAGVWSLVVPKTVYKKTSTFRKGEPWLKVVLQMM